MNKTNQNHTDNFFKQGLNSPPEFAPSEKNWEAMEKLLKPESEKRAIGWLYVASGIAAAMLIFLSLWFSQHTGSEQIVKNRKPPTPAKAQGGAAPASKRERVVANNKTFSTKDPDSEQVLEKSVQLFPFEHRKINKSVTNLEFTAVRESLNPARFLNVTGSTADLSSGKTNVKMIAMDTSRNEMGKTTLEASVTDSDSDPRSKDLSGRWALSMAVSPDLNSVANVGKSRFGISFGAGASYRISKAINVATGIYYSQKLYSADKSSYKVKQKPFATWTSYSNRIDADCRVIDIPVNLSFRVSNTKRNKLHAIAGLSSYIMLTEKYSFIYNPTPAYPSGGREYTVRNQNKHILSVMNLGVALEKPLADQVSLVIQPYAKIPLTGIGQGETDLKSFGIGFRLNYSLKRD